MSIETLIFSRNRAMQLDLLLRSIQRFAPIASRAHVLVSSDNGPHSEAYARLADEHPQVRLYSQSTWPSFQVFTESFLEGAILDRVCFLVDDDLFYCVAPPVPPLDHPLPFSLRPGDYDYLFTLDGGIYDPAQVLQWTHGQRYRDPTQFEAGVASLVEGQSFPEEHRYPCLVGVPHNRVSASSGMPSMGGDPMDLCERYLYGERIDLDALTEQIDEHNVAPHMNLTYSYQRR